MTHSSDDENVYAGYGCGLDLTNEFDDCSSPRLILDFGSSYQITHAVRFYFDAKNLLNTPLKFIEGTSESNRRRSSASSTI